MTFLNDYEKPTRQHYEILFMSWAGWVFDFYDLILFSFLLIPIGRELQLSNIGLSYISWSIACGNRNRRRNLRNSIRPLWPEKRIAMDDINLQRWNISLRVRFLSRSTGDLSNHYRPRRRRRMGNRTDIRRRIFPV